MRERRADLADLTVLADLDDLIVLAHLADGVDVVAVLDAGGELDARCDEISVLARVGERLLNLDREHLAVNGHSLGRIARAAAVHLDTQGHSLVHRAMVGGLQPGHIGLQGCRAAGLQGCRAAARAAAVTSSSSPPMRRRSVSRSTGGRALWYVPASSCRKTSRLCVQSAHCSSRSCTCRTEVVPVHAHAGCNRTCACT